MKILITGGAGFIGSHLAEAFLNQGDEVYIIDDLSTGALDNIKHLQENKEQRKISRHHRHGIEPGQDGGVGGNL